MTIKRDVFNEQALQIQHRFPWQISGCNKSYVSWGSINLLMKTKHTELYELFSQAIQNASYLIN